ncbi:glycoside hydrolase family 27 protein [Clostridium sp. SHJSY1]|uniref:glycoside hydrolase family 27 protein n=1 Tax=Clostridium sp. SHJSY1 TaxID=2942483 RepID=UPI002874A66E|nr:glycoside hydrolase family 27 protein [Clostridium sp. SHJSY1]MDS0527811.1 glycoside hydrolase family 27 protein [Clostridium sp. SHJSY1]
MNKNKFAITPPMGWNSYDYYDTTVNEEQVKANAYYMAEHLKEFGWEYIVVDIEWYAYDTGKQREQYQYKPFGKVEIDEYSRLLPCPDRFPSSVNGQGFKPLADYVHDLGLKFGIHIMRGIPRIAAHNHMKILGTKSTANEIANPYSICMWNPDMYGVEVNIEGAQEYYNSIFELYAQWGVDYVKFDDIGRYDASSAEREIEMIHNAIEQCGHPIVLSLSPGPALIEKSWYYEKYANMWRITDDFWDSWNTLLNMFERCEIWQNHVSEGCYPDCDMLPLGCIGKGFNNERYTNFTKEEQVTMMTLWCIFRSPLMLGAELTKLDEWTKAIITNKKVLRLLSNSKGAKQIMRNKEQAIWLTRDLVEDIYYLAAFNLSDEKRKISIRAEEIELNSFKDKKFKELWCGKVFEGLVDVIKVEVLAHGAKLYKIQDI